MKAGSAPEASEQSLRVDLAAAFRLAVEFDWHESVGNHFSAAVSANGQRFLMNPRWRHFASIRASDLVLLDATDSETMSRPDPPDASAWCIHGAIHAQMPAARIVLHCHPPYATALACLKDPRMLPVDQTTARFFGRVALDLGYSGMADVAAEGQRLAASFQDRPILLMGNHGVTVTAPTVAEAFEHLYLFERASKTLLLAYGAGQELSVLPDAVAAKTAQEWRPYDDMAFAHFDALKAMLDKKDRSYRD
jgi:ribulose-5-phosphate 4-epimerase/fuculose-1-phosphate aldolase